MSQIPDPITIEWVEQNRPELVNMCKGKSPEIMRRTVLAMSNSEDVAAESITGLDNEVSSFNSIAHWLEPYVAPKPPTPEAFKEMCKTRYTNTMKLFYEAGLSVVPYSHPAHKLNLHLRNADGKAFIPISWERRDKYTYEDDKYELVGDVKYNNTKYFPLKKERNSAQFGSISGVCAAILPGPDYIGTDVDGTPIPRLRKDGTQVRRSIYSDFDGSDDKQTLSMFALILNEICKRQKDPELAKRSILKSSKYGHFGFFADYTDDFYTTLGKGWGQNIDLIPHGCSSDAKFELRNSPNTLAYTAQPEGLEFTREPFRPEVLSFAIVFDKEIAKLLLTHFKISSESSSTQTKEQNLNNPVQPQPDLANKPKAVVAYEYKKKLYEVINNIFEIVNQVYDNCRTQNIEFFAPDCKERLDLAEYILNLLKPIYEIKHISDIYESNHSQKNFIDHITHIIWQLSADISVDLEMAERMIKVLLFIAVENPCRRKKYYEGKEPYYKADYNSLDEIPTIKDIEDWTNTPFIKRAMEDKYNSQYINNLTTDTWKGTIYDGQTQWVYKENWREISKTDRIKTNTGYEHILGIKSVVGESLGEICFVKEGTYPEYIKVPAAGNLATHKVNAYKRLTGIANYGLTEELKNKELEPVCIRRIPIKQFGKTGDFHEGYPVYNTHIMKGPMKILTGIEKRPNFAPPFFTRFFLQHLMCQYNEQEIGEITVKINGREITEKFYHNPRVEQVERVIAYKGISPLRDVIIGFVGKPRIGKDMWLDNALGGVFEGSYRAVNNENYCNDSFNAHYADKLVLVINDFSNKMNHLERAKFIDTYKTRTGMSTMMVNAKGVAQFYIDNYQTIWISANSEPDFDLGRWGRLSLIEVMGGEKDQKLWDVDNWFQDLVYESEGIKKVGFDALGPLIKREGYEYAAYLRNKYIDEDKPMVDRNKILLPNSERIDRNIFENKTTYKKLIYLLDYINETQGCATPQQAKEYIKHISMLANLIYKEPYIHSASNKELFELFTDNYKTHCHGEQLPSPPFSALMQDLLPINCIAFMLNMQSPSNRDSADFDSYTQKKLLSSVEVLGKLLERDENDEPVPYRIESNDMYIFLPGFTDELIKHKLFPPEVVEMFKEAGGDKVKLNAILEKSKVDNSIARYVDLAKWDKDTDLVSKREARRKHLLEMKLKAEEIKRRTDEV